MQQTFMQERCYKFEWLKITGPSANLRATVQMSGGIHKGLPGKGSQALFPQQEVSHSYNGFPITMFKKYPCQLNVTFNFQLVAR